MATAEDTATTILMKASTALVLAMVRAGILNEDVVDGTTPMATVVGMDRISTRPKLPTTSAATFSEDATTSSTAASGANTYTCTESIGRPTTVQTSTIHAHLWTGVSGTAGATRDGNKTKAICYQGTATRRRGTDTAERDSVYLAEQGFGKTVGISDFAGIIFGCWDSGSAGREPGDSERRY